MLHFKWEKQKESSLTSSNSLHENYRSLLKLEDWKYDLKNLLERDDTQIFHQLFHIFLNFLKL